MAQNGLETGSWSSTLFHCTNDEETCWWGTWCCWLLSARNEETFDVGNAFTQSCTFFSFVVVAVIILLIAPPLGSFFLIVGALSYAYYRAGVRTAIRTQLAIPGSLCNDFFLHTCCTCCAVCQEGREAKRRGKRNLDFCFGQEIDITNEAPVAGVICDEALIAEDANILNHMKHLSRTSRLLLGVGTGLLIFVPILTGQTALTMVVLGIVFVQPLLILYFLYWRSRRKHVLLDYVVKLFVCGFCLATTQSMLFESLLQGIFGILLVIILLLTDPGALSLSMAGAATGSTNGAIISSVVGGGTFAQQVNHMMSSYRSVRSHDMLFSVANTDEMLNMSHSMTDSSTDIIRSLLQSNNGTSDSMIPVSSESARKHVVLAVIALLFMAYVVAAGVEETMKHCVVRFCRFPSALKNPNAIMVYLLVAALGFATAENIEYVFGSGTKSPVPGTSLFVGELFVLFMRVCMPVHLICAVLQSVNLSKVLLGYTPMNVFMVLLPAIFLHGSFDFALFLLGFIEYAYGIQSISFEVFSFVTPIAITIAGIVWAYREFTQIVDKYENSWQRLNTSEHEERDIAIIDANL